MLGLAFVLLLLGFVGLLLLGLRLAALLGVLLGDRWGGVFFYLSLGVAPYHYVADEDESFIILERFFHHLDTELDILSVGLVDVVDVNLTLLCGLFSK